ncbi:MAG: tetratricopeptide repeat protein [Hyphomicrobiaceae bacterium]
MLAGAVSTLVLASSTVSFGGSGRPSDDVRPATSYRVAETLEVPRPAQDPSGARTPRQPDAATTPPAQRRVEAGWSGVQRHADAERWDDALETALETLALSQSALGDDMPHTIVSHRIVGDLLMRASRPAEAIAHYFDAFQASTRRYAADTPNFTEAVLRLRDAYLAAGQVGNVDALLRHVISVGDANIANESSELLRVRRAYGQFLRQQGRLQEAETQFLRIVRVRERLGNGDDDLALVVALTDLGGALRVQGRYSEAEASYTRALALARAARGDSDTTVGILLDNLGGVFQERGQFSAAEKVRREALAIFEEVLDDDHLTTALGRANLAALYMEQGRLREARPLYERALATYQARLPESDARLGVLLDNFGGLARMEGKRDEALALYEAALRSLSAAYPETHPAIATSLNNIALEEQVRDNHPRAEALFRRALAINDASMGPNYHANGIVWGNLADTLIAQKKVDAARAALERSVSILESALDANSPQLIRPLRVLAGLLFGQGDIDAALEVARRSVRLESLKRERLRLDPEGMIETEGTDNAFLGALYLFERIVAERPELRDGLAAEAFDLAQRAASTAAARSIGQISVRLAASGRGAGVLVRERQDLAKAWKAADARLASAAGGVRASDTASGIRRELRDIEARLEALDRRLVSEFPDFERLDTYGPKTVSDVRGVLAPDEALVFVVSRGEALHVFVVTAVSMAWRTLEMTASQAAGHVQALRCGLDSAEWTGETRPLACLDLLGRTPDGSGVLPFDLARAHALYRGLFDPVGDLISNRRLLLVPNDVLGRVPAHVLLNAPPVDGAPWSKQPWLALKAAVTVVPSVSGIVTLRAVERISTDARRPFLGVANPLLIGVDGVDRSAFTVRSCSTATRAHRAAGQFALRNSGVESVRPAMRGGVAEVESVRRLTPLPETALEVCEVARTVGADRDAVILSGRATERELRRRNAAGDLSRYRVLHFATHGLVAGEVDGLPEPALVLTPPEIATPEDDGLLTASEVAEFKLDADWVVLSACNTAAGAAPGAEALSGLARAFIYAGARALLVSHWPVDSDAAVRLTTATTVALAEDPTRSRAEALRLAMAGLIDGGAGEAYAHPAIWAPFSVVGTDWSDLGQGRRAPLADGRVDAGPSGTQRATGEGLGPERLPATADPQRPLGTTRSGTGAPATGEPPLSQSSAAQPSATRPAQRSRQARTTPAPRPQPVPVAPAAPAVQGPVAEDWRDDVFARD